MAGNSGYHHSMADNADHHTMSEHSLTHSPFFKLQTASTLLVTEWSTESIYGLTGAMIAAVVASVTYECLHEYLQYIRRNALTKPNGPKCCGAPVVTFGEKLGQSIIHILRVLFAYFMMLCVMTMNIWLLVAVVVGSAVGYGVGKPLVANRIDDTITSHGYDTAPATLHRHGNRSERSRSWRYQPIVRSERDMKTRQTDADDIFLEDSDVFDSNSRNCRNGKNGADIIWLRRSNDDLRSRPSEISDVFDDSDVQLRTQSDTYNVDSIRSEDRQSSRSTGRFRSTSKVINDSFRSYRSDSEMRKHSTSGNTSLNLSFDGQNLDLTEKRQNTSKSSSSKVGRTVSAAAASSRFKPVSREIMRHISFNEDLR